MNIDLTPILQAVIGLLAAVITYKLVPWIKANTTIRQRDMMQATVKTLVYAAEQIYGAGTGKEKLEYVENELRVRGFAVDLAAIEAAVKQMSDGVWSFETDD